MNGDSATTIERCALDARALVVCSICNQPVSTYDDEAERRAYALATNALKNGERGVRGMERGEVVHLVKQTLDRYGDCACSTMFDH